MANKKFHVNLTKDKATVFFIFVGALSTGVAVLTYSSIEPMVLSFNVGDDVTIYSKEAGQNKELWGAEVTCS